MSPISFLYVAAVESRAARCVVNYDTQNTLCAAPPAVINAAALRSQRATIRRLYPFNVVPADGPCPSTTIGGISLLVDRSFRTDWTNVIKQQLQYDPPPPINELKKPARKRSAHPKTHIFFHIQLERKQKHVAFLLPSAQNKRAILLLELTSKLLANRAKTCFQK